ncbi:uncharacterized protein LOC132751860 [Ruditapes philippinarum]|uniref:uncharacterized protein LOC132751860 n=1 Tax=Ruditapes philippinarum TaxID=129788 RepID=UPI00295C17F0|nr:uncharacterized protein LOC132751860 [Ruditapes philippinarum]
MNITSNIYGFPWIPADKLSDRNSPRFKEAQNFFCGKINEMFQSEPVVGNAVKERYYRCFICNFKQTNLHFEAPVSFTYSLVFNGSDPVPKAVVDGLIASNTEIYHFGNKVWNLIGDWLVNRVDVTMVSVNMSDYIKQEKQVKQNPNIDNPCFPDKNNVILPDMTNPSGYISCNHGNELRFTCDQNMAFDPKTSKCVKSATVLA